MWQQTIHLFCPWICATIEISFAQQAQLPMADLLIVGLLGSISLFLDHSSSRNQVSSPSFQDQDFKPKFSRPRFQVQEPKEAKKPNHCQPI